MDWWPNLLEYCIDLEGQEYLRGIKSGFIYVPYLTRDSDLCWLKLDSENPVFLNQHPVGPPKLTSVILSHDYDLLHAERSYKP